jgi:hypothetical protein
VIAGGARLGGGAVDPAGGLVGTLPVVAGFGGGYGHGGPLRGRTASPAVWRWRPTASRRMPGVRRDPPERAARVGEGEDLLPFRGWMAWRVAFGRPLGGRTGD